MNRLKVWYYKHIRYRKQTKQGFGTLAEYGTKVFFVNGVDPIKRLDIVSPHGLDKHKVITFTRYAPLKDVDENTSNT